MGANVSKLNQSKQSLFPHVRKRTKCQVFSCLVESYKRSQQCSKAQVCLELLSWSSCTAFSAYCLPYAKPDKIANLITVLNPSVLSICGLVMGTKYITVLIAIADSGNCSTQLKRNPYHFTKIRFVYLPSAQDQKLGMTEKYSLKIRHLAVLKFYFECR